MGGDAATSPLLSATLFTPYRLLTFGLSALAAFALPNTQKILGTLTPVKLFGSIGLLAASLAVLFWQGFNPFLYFQF